jgi:riboflavin biosynthesis pyrimidine reductase
VRRLYPTPGEITGPADLEDHYLVEGPRHVRANFVLSLDGKVELDGRSGSLGGQADRAAFLAMRAVADVILVGAGTVRQERYGPVRLDAAVVERRRARHQTPVPALAIVSNRADLDQSARVFGGDTKPFLLTTATAAAQRRDLADAAEVIACGDECVDLTLGLNELYTRGLGRVLCEGGPTLLRSLLDAELLDELCCTTSPWLAGGGRQSLLGDQPLPTPVAFSITSVLEGDQMVLARYQRRARR